MQTIRQGIISDEFLRTTVKFVCELPETILDATEELNLLNLHLLTKLEPVKNAAKQLLVETRGGVLFEVSSEMTKPDPEPGTVVPVDGDPTKVKAPKQKASTKAFPNDATRTTETDKRCASNDDYQAAYRTFIQTESEVYVHKQKIADQAALVERHKLTLSVRRDILKLAGALCQEDTTAKDMARFSKLMTAIEQFNGDNNHDEKTD